MSARARCRPRTCRARSPASRPGSASWCCSPVPPSTSCSPSWCCGACCGPTASPRSRRVVGEVAAGLGRGARRACAPATRSAPSTARRSASQRDVVFDLLDAMSSRGEADLDRARQRRRDARSVNLERAGRRERAPPDRARRAAAADSVSSSGCRRCRRCSARSCRMGPRRAPACRPATASSPSTALRVTDFRDIVAHDQRAHPGAHGQLRLPRATAPRTRCRSRSRATRSAASASAASRSGSRRQALPAEHDAAHRAVARWRALGPRRRGGLEHDGAAGAPVLAHGARAASR